MSTFLTSISNLWNKPDKPQPPFPFGDLLEELQREIISLLDGPTRSSLSWTCRHYHQAIKEEFDCFKFADQCAELGYRTLLAYSLERGAPFDKHTWLTAARFGQEGILELYAHHHPRQATDNEKILEEAAAGGQAKLVSKCLREFMNTDDPSPYAHSPDIAAKIAAVCGHVAVALQILKAIGSENAKDLADFVFLLDEPTIFRLLSLTGLNWAAAQFPTLLTPEVRKNITLRAIAQGRIDILQWAEERGAVIDLALLCESCQFGEVLVLPYIRSLRYFHLKLNLTKSPFPNNLERTRGPVTIKDMEWLKEQEYQLSNVDYKDLLDHGCLDQEMLKWLLQHGFKPSNGDIKRFFVQCRIDLLAVLWQAKILVPDGKDHVSLLEHLDLLLANLKFRRSHFVPHLRTFKWLRDKGFTWDKCFFVFSYLKKKGPQLCNDLHLEIEALNLEYDTTILPAAMLGEHL